jgi:hypothetical protein
MLKDYYKLLTQALVLRPGKSSVPANAANYVQVGIGIAILALVQAAIVIYSVVSSPGIAPSVILVLAILSALWIAIPMVVLTGIAALSGRMDRLPLALVATTFYLSIFAAVSFALSFVMSGTSGGLTGALAYFIYRTARTALGLSVARSIVTAALVVVASMASGLLVLVIPGGEALVSP